MKKRKKKVIKVESLYEAAGGDYDDLLRRIPKEDMVKRFLKKYVTAETFDAMIKAYEDGDYDRLFRESHNLKGMSANLSLKKNYMTISAICEEVRNGNPTDKLPGYIETAKIEHQELIDLVSQLD